MSPAKIITDESKREVLDYWNSKKITQHKRLTTDLERGIVIALRKYSFEELKELIDFYATILEPGLSESEKKYFWTYKWNLWEFLQRGTKKFDGQDVSNYLRKQKVEGPEAVIFKRK